MTLTTAAIAFLVAVFSPIGFEPVTVGAQQGEVVELLGPGDLERTPRDYLAVAATVKSAGNSEVALTLVDVLNREYTSQTVELTADKENTISLDMDAIGRPVSLLRAVKLSCKGAAVQVSDLRFYCAAERLPGPHVTIEGPQNSSSIQAALDALGADGGIVYIPAGTYLLTEQVNIPTSNISIYGDGPDTILQGTWTGAADLIVADNKQNLRFSRLHLRSLSEDECRSHPAGTKPLDEKPPASAKKRGLHIIGCENVRVDHCEVELFGNVGIMFTDCTNSLVDHCFAHGYFPYASGYGIGARGCDETYIEDNNIENHRHGITTYNGCHKSYERYNRLVKDPFVVPEWYTDAKSITYLSSYQVNAHPGCGWLCVHDNYIAITTGLMWTGAEMRGNSGWLYRNLIKACTIGITCTRDSDDVWTWDNEFQSVTVNHVSTAEGRIHFGEKPPDFTEIPYPHQLNRMGWWPGGGESVLTLAKPATQFAGPADALVLQLVNMD